MRSCVELSAAAGASMREWRRRERETDRDTRAAPFVVFPRR
jgi:hypothetical protein